MAQNRFGVPENETWRCEFPTLPEAVWRGREKACRRGSKWDVYWADSGALTGRKNGRFVV